MTQHFRSAATAWEEPSILGVNINLWWGLALLLSGAVMLLLARRSTQRNTKAIR
jgi:hypothetical protein